MKEGMISIVIPVYNAERFLGDTVKTIKEQTYENWEAIFINDCSKDNSAEIIKKYATEDDRIKLVELSENSGAAKARNKGIELAEGQYIAFLDADDLWKKEKLEKQLKFMQENNYSFTFTGYEFANEDGKPNGKKVYVPQKMNYKDALGNTTIWTCTVMFDLKKLSKEDIYMPIVPSEDTACWWKVLKHVDYAYGMSEILSFYRRSEGTLSSNKFVAIKRIWFLYRNVEKLNVFKSMYCFILYTYHAIMRRI